jgi:DNA polymerase III subunit epsilon
MGMREIVLDTETTGLDPGQGHRIIEIGALELVNHIPSGRTYHTYLNPQRPMPPEAQAVHGLGDRFLSDKPVFAAVADDFLGFIAEAPLVIHNAGFDLAFLNAELDLAQKPPLPGERVIDTLALARRKHPMGPNSLDALCKRYNIDNSRRVMHGALLDSELLADVYVELIGGRQTSLILGMATIAKSALAFQGQPTAGRPRPLPARLSDTERECHDRFVEALGVSALWSKLAG